MPKKKYLTLEWRKKLGYKAIAHKKPSRFVTLYGKKYKVDPKLWELLSKLEEGEEREKFLKKLKMVD